MGGKRRSVKKKRQKPSKSQELRVISQTCAGIDLGSREHWVCCPPKEGEPNVKTFGTTTGELKRIAEFLAQEGITSVAMESTGVYWIPIFELLEERGFEVVLVDTRKLSYVPGRKTDMLDCQWIQQLHSYGLLSGAFRPPEEICELRALVREKANMVRSRADWIRRMQKCLDQMNIQIHRAVTDITGKTGMSILRAMLAGERNPTVLAGLRDRRCQKSCDEIAEHLRGNWREEHLFNLGQALHMYDTFTEVIQRYEQKILECVEKLQPDEHKNQVAPEVPDLIKGMTIEATGLEPDREALYKMAGVDLCQIDGIGVQTTYVILSEIGPDVSRFPTEKQFVSYVGLAPKTPKTGGKPMKGKKRKGSTSTQVGEALRMAATSLKYSQTALGGYYRRMSSRKEPAVAVFATARKLAELIYRMLRYGAPYVDEGLDAYEQRFQERRMLRCQNTAQEFGFQLVPIE
jgi:transposase